MKMDKIDRLLFGFAYLGLFVWIIFAIAASN